MQQKSSKDDQKIPEAELLSGYESPTIAKDKAEEIPYEGSQEGSKYICGVISPKFERYGPLLDNQSKSSFGILKTQSKPCCSEIQEPLTYEKKKLKVTFRDQVCKETKTIVEVDRSKQQSKVRALNTK